MPSSEYKKPHSYFEENLGMFSKSWDKKKVPRKQVREDLAYMWTSRNDACLQWTFLAVNCDLLRGRYFWCPNVYTAHKVSDSDPKCCWIGYELRKT